MRPPKQCWQGLVPGWQRKPRSDNLEFAGSNSPGRQPELRAPSAPDSASKPEMTSNSSSSIPLWRRR